MNETETRSLSPTSRPSVAEPKAPGLPAGTVLAGRFRILGMLGRGGMGEVYRAEDLTLRQEVALKFLPPSLEGSPEHLSGLLEEVRAARQVTHPNVCRVHDIMLAEGRRFLSMELVDGEDLASLLRRVERLTPKRACESPSRSPRRWRRSTPEESCTGT